ncbi:hypothetical protein QQ054_33145 [Oscillatoria amoena NRMC-F 0135]|nr:hypothetical protein [Oscillatoria amoena NRMC-F 0135]
MKKILKLMVAMLSITGMVFLASCDDDDTEIGGGGSVPVADGYYITQVGINPVATSQLKPEKVEADGFATQDRAGFVANYVYLTPGNYEVVLVIDQEISKKFGGVSAVTGTTGSDCSLNEYTLIEEFEENGAPIAVATEGLYKVAYDNTEKEIWVTRIQKFHVIGGATSFGWSQNDLGELNLEAGGSATALTYKRTNVEMKKGDWKVRFNCRWSVDRRIDSGSGFGADNGYVAFTNIGGALNATLPGGSNFSIPFGQDGKYTITLNWTAAAGFTVTTENTEPIAPKPVDEYAWGIIGSATPITDWSADTDLPLISSTLPNSATYEIASITLTGAPGEFKFRANDEWGTVLKPGIDILGTEGGANAADFESTGGGDPSWRMKTATVSPGNYKITIATTNGGEKWNITFVRL